MNESKKKKKLMGSKNNMTEEYEGHVGGET